MAASNQHHQVKCHYEILSVPRDADAATIKKAHRKLALLHHPDKNLHLSPEEQHQSAHEFKLIQAAYECLSDPVERKWYDEHREMILRGGVDRNGSSGDDADVNRGISFLFDVVPYQFAGCYEGYDDGDPDGFYTIYQSVFDQILQGEREGYISEGNIDLDEMPNANLSEVSFGSSTSRWDDVSAFYSVWEAFSSSLSFAWADTYHLSDIRDAPNRRIRRLMEDDNRKKRKNAKRERVEEICALVRFVKRRDPRVKKQREKVQRQQVQKEAEKKKEAEERKKEIAAAREEWRAEAERKLAEQEAADLDAGRIRLADLDSDDEVYGRNGGNGKRGKKNKGKKKRKGKNNIPHGCSEETNMVPDIMDEKPNLLGAEASGKAISMKNEKYDDSGGECTFSASLPHDNEEHDYQGAGDMNVTISDLNEDEGELLCANVSGSSSDESEEPDSWRCECCRKDFKSEKQFENHVKSKKHKETLKKYEKKLRQEAEKAAVNDLIHELTA